MSMSRLQCSVARGLGLRMMAISPFSQTIVAAATDVTLPPNAKKYPRSGFSVFQQDPKVQQKLGIGTDLAKNSKLFSEEWKKVSDADKAKYKSQQEKLKAEFESRSPEDKPVKTKKKSNAPLTKYAVFVKEQYADVKKGMGPNVLSPQVFKEVAKKWSALSDAQKAKYGPSS